IYNYVRSISIRVYRCIHHWYRTENGVCKINCVKGCFPAPRGWETPLDTVYFTDPLKKLLNHRFLVVSPRNDGMKGFLDTSLMRNRKNYSRSILSLSSLI